MDVAFRQLGKLGKKCEMGFESEHVNLLNCNIEADVNRVSSLLTKQVRQARTRIISFTCPFPHIPSLKILRDIATHKPKPTSLIVSSEATAKGLTRQAHIQLVDEPECRRRPCCPVMLPEI